LPTPEVLDPPTQTAYEGTVIRAQSGFYYIRTPTGEIVEASARGKLKLARGDERITSKTLVVVGDEVTYAIGADGRGVITEVAERRSKLARKAAFKDKEHVIVANLDQLAIVMAAAHPSPSLRGLDRYLIIAEHNNVEPLIVVNKIDLLAPGVPDEVFGLYRDIGYRVIYTSVRKGEGLEELRAALVGKVSALAGPSGVGKSSLLNKIQPGLGQSVSAISQSTGKGRHTTSATELFPLDGGGYIADTAGLREIGLWDMDEGEIAAGFREFRQFIPLCRFSGCTHIHEPGCAILAAVERGDISTQRYESFLRLIEDDATKDEWEK
jgi:ribosome biogenesis GTPase / thiamine phosphate phosphatase